MAGTVWATLGVRNEVDVIGATLAHLLSEGVDGILVLDNGSDDGTLDVLYDFAGRVEVPVEIRVDPEVGYYQSRRMTNLGRLAAERGAGWVLPVDADEVWYGPVPLAEYLRSLPSTVEVVAATLWNHYRTDEDVPSPDPFTSMVWRHPEPGALAKVAYRPDRDVVVDAGNHSTSRNGTRVPAPWSDLAVRHFPYRSESQFVAKGVGGARAYAAAPDLPDGMGDHWRNYGRIAAESGVDALVEVYRQHFYYPNPSSTLVRDPAACLRWAGGPRS